ncbi:MAG: ORC1-type DNA replication protein [Archaeoglobaceae archaeon]|nr:ORC1-type DNA replication protein [Archaeoglobaceae archaeon]MCX8152557.1 ORC1-type DNA replication protein [Archaeoglobaceae archaeon]MDW8014161.1 ORC1-type DNA replication protein [Archaeoglobaceae archaeon]
MNIFERFLSSSKIFKNREVLWHSYTPDYLPHREEQIEQLATLLSPILKGGNPSNIFIYGKTGTGKTATVRFVTKQLLEICKKLNLNLNVVYLNCEIVDTTFRILAKLAKALGRDIPDTGLSIDQVYSEILKVFEKRENSKVLIVLDEIDKIVKRAEEALYSITRINSEIGTAKVSIIGITNNLKFKESLDARILSSLSEEEIVFPPYNAEQLEDILRQRAEMAFNDGVIECGVIELCAAIAAQEHGDARKALDLLRVSAEIAERLCEDKVKVEHVRMALKKIECDRVSETIKTLPVHSKILLYGIAILSDMYEKFTTGEIYTVYKRLCGKVGLTALTQRRISDLISELDMLGILNSVIISKGRYGRTREIKLETDSKFIKSVLEEDYRLKDLRSYEDEIKKFAKLILE